MKCPKDGCPREGDRDTLEGHIYASADHDNDLADDLDDPPEKGPSEGGNQGSDEGTSQNTPPEGDPQSEGQQAAASTPDDPPSEGDPEGGIEGSDEDDNTDTMPTDEEYQEARTSAGADDDADQNSDKSPATRGLPADPVTVGGIVFLVILIYLGMKWVRSSSEGPVSQEDVDVDLEDSTNDTQIDLIEE